MTYSSVLHGSSSFDINNPQLLETLPISFAYRQVCRRRDKVRPRRLTGDDEYSDAPYTRHRRPCAAPKHGCATSESQHGYNLTVSIFDSSSFRKFLLGRANLPFARGPEAASIRRQQRRQRVYEFHIPAAGWRMLVVALAEANRRDGNGVHSPCNSRVRGNIRTTTRGMKRVGESLRSARARTRHYLGLISLSAKTNDEVPGDLRFRSRGDHSRRDYVSLRYISRYSAYVLFCWCMAD